MATGGGNATAAGVTMQASVAASIAVQIISGSALDSRLRLGAAIPVSIRLETEAPVDDILVETDAGGWVFIQAKNTLRMGTTLKSELGKTCDEFARLWQLASVGDGANDWDRPLTGEKDAMVIAVGPASSGSIKVVLARALDALRMGSTATLSNAGRESLTSFRNLMRAAFDFHGASDDLDLDVVLKLIYVIDFDFGGPHRELAENRLANSLEQPDASPAGFSVIERECQNAMAARGRLDGDRIRGALEAGGPTVKVRREGSLEAHVATQESLRRQQGEIPPSYEIVAENPIVTREAERRLRQLRQLRMIIGFDVRTACVSLCKATENGDLASASRAVRQSIFAWCSRILAAQDLQEAGRVLANAESYGTTDETRIARAVLEAFAPNGDKSAAIATLEPLGTPEAIAATLIIVAHEESPAVGLAWLEKARLPLEKFHPDGKFRIMSLQLNADDWSAALETANDLMEADFIETPALIFLAASVHLGQAVHPDLRDVLQLPLPQQPADFRLGDDAASMKSRSEAIALYKRAASVFGALEADKASAISSDRALWLELSDPVTYKAAINALQESMADEKVRLRRLPLATAFGLKLNIEAIERDIERATALSGGKSIDAAVARLVVALTREAPEAADYIEQHRKQLIEYYKPSYIDSVAIEALAKAGRTEEARKKLIDVKGNISEDRITSTLENLIEEAEGADPIARRESEYAAQSTLHALISLVDELERARDYTRLAQYGERLFDELKDIESAKTYLSALHATNADDKIIAFAEAYSEVVQASEDAENFVSWAYYRLGRLSEAKARLDSRRSNREVADDRNLFMHIAIASGDWSSLNAFVESEWENRSDREPAELIRAGALAQHIGSEPRSRELVREAARRADRDPEVLVAAYGIASSSDWEEDADIHDWLATAIETSGENGPIQRMDIREIIEEQPAWNERVDHTWGLLLRGEAPMFVAASAARRSLLDLFLRPALQNLRELDPRKRGLIFAFAGNRQIQSIDGKRLALDITSLLSLSLTGRLGGVLDWCESVYVSHTTLSWLFEERAKLAFHQPSQVRRAREVRRLLDAGHLHQFEGSTPPPTVEQEVGDNIARCLLAAQTFDDEDGSQKIVVRPYPFFQPGSLLEVMADVSGFEEHIAGTIDVVNALQNAGHLTEEERTNALAFLQLHETPWPHDPKVEPGATLYLDDVAIAYFQHLKLLHRLAQAGFKVFINSSEVDRVDELINLDEFGAEARRTVEDIQVAIRDSIATGKVTLGRLVLSDRENDVNDSHPSFSMIGEVLNVDALVIDDRFINKHPTTNVTPNVTTIDVLAGMAEDGAITKDQLTQAMTLLRQAGAIFVPHRAGEIEQLLNAAPTSGSEVLETAELRAVRESITRVRMTDALQLPNESEWIDNLTKELLSALSEPHRDCRRLFGLSYAAMGTLSCIA